MIGNDTPTRSSQIPLPTISPEFQNAHLQTSGAATGPRDAGLCLAAYLVPVNVGPYSGATCHVRFQC
jgi:hypothetical protein